MSSELKSVNKKPHETTEGKKREFVFFREMSQNLHLFIIAAITWATYQSKIIEQNGTFESASRQRLVYNVLPHVMQRWVQRCRLWRLVYSNSAKACCIFCTLDRVHATQGPRQSSPVAVSFQGASWYSCFGAYLSTIAVFTQAQMNCTCAQSSIGLT